MAWAEKYGKKGLWRARYKKPDGTIGSEPGFRTERKAETWGNLQEEKIKTGDWTDPKKAKTLFREWVERWWDAQDLAESTTAKYRFQLEHMILPYFGTWEIGRIGPVDVATWEKEMRKKYEPVTVTDARKRLRTIFADAIAEGMRGTNPAERNRRRGQDHEEADAAAESLWATPLEVLLIAERCALLTGRPDDFALVVMAAYSGTRWAESIGLEKPYCRVATNQTIRIEWHIPEVDGVFYRRHPKKASRRTAQEPPFLCELLARLMAERPNNRCRCDHQEHPNEFVFLGPEKGHPRRGNWDMRVFRPACDGVHPSRGKTMEARPVLVDHGAGWPGIPLSPAWPYAGGDDWEPPRGKGIARHEIPPQMVLAKPCPAQGCQAASGEACTSRTGRPTTPHRGRTAQAAKHYAPAFASWLPIVQGLTFHDLRHSHKTWMIEATIPEVAQAERLGHKLGGVRGVYSHTTPAMLRQIQEVLEGLWEESLTHRAAMAPRSPVPLLDELLAPYRVVVGDDAVAAGAAPLSEKISTIPPLQRSRATLRVVR